MLKKLRRWRRNCLLVVVGLLLLCLALYVGAVVLVRRANAQEVAYQPLDVLLLIDHSDSMWEKGGVGSDPQLLRLDAAGLFISYLGLDAEPGGHRLGVIRFGGESELIVPLTPVADEAQRAALRAALADPTPMGWTDPLQALELAYQELFLSERSTPDRRPVVVLLTDGKPEIPSLTTAQERAAYIDALRSRVESFRDRACPIFTIALTNEATEADPEIQTVYRNLWQEIAALTPPGEYREARTAQDLPHAYHAVVAHLSGVEAEAPLLEAEVEGELTRSIPVEEGLARLVLLVFKSDPTITVRLVRPGGALARAEDPDVSHVGSGGAREEVWSILDPRPGAWRIELSGHGEVLVWRDTALSSASPAYTVALRAPPAYVPAGQDLEIAAVVHEDGKPLRDPAVQVLVELRRAGFPEATLLAQVSASAEEPVYTATHTDPAPGAYTLLVRALRDGQEIARREGAVEVVQLPQMEVFAPVPGQILHPGEPVIVSLAVAIPHPTAAPTAVIRGPSGVVTPVHLSPQIRAGEYVGSLPAPAVAGSYTLALHLRGSTPQGLPYDETEVIPLEVVLPEPPVWKPPGWVWPVGIALLGVAGTGGTLALRRARQRVRLEGQWRVLSAPARHSAAAGRMIDMPRKRAAATLGGQGEDALRLPGDSTNEAPLARLEAERDPGGGTDVWLRPLDPLPEAGLVVNGRPLLNAHRLRDGDVVVAGSYRLRYENLDQAIADRVLRTSGPGRVAGGGR
jgi:uncharacterized protein YegL